MDDVDNRHPELAYLSFFMPLFDRSLESHIAGRLNEAEAGYRSVLAQNPRHADALHLLGLILRDHGVLTEAESSIRQAIAVDEQARFVGSLGSVLLDEGCTVEAEAMFRRAIELDARAPAAYYNLAVLLLDATRAGEAEAALRQVFALDARFPGAHRNAGRAMFMLARLDEAEAFFRGALERDSADARAMSGLAAVLAHEERLDDAKAACEAAIRMAPHFFDAHLNLGAVLLRLDRLDEAEAVLRHALSLDGQQASGHFNLGTVLMGANRSEEAQASLQRALELDPSYVEAWLNLGRVLEGLQRLDDAESAYRSGLAARPADPDLQANLALVLLAKGQFAEGWRLYESRFAARHGGPLAWDSGFASPQWRGEALRGKSLVVVAEQGFGDTLQFCRYLPLLKAKGLKHLTVVCERPLSRLIEEIEEVDACITRADASGLRAHDYWCFMMSLPLRFNTALDSIPALVPYLRAPDGLADAWKTRLPGASPKVGLVWAGERRRDIKNADAVDKRRSIHARQFLPLLQVPGVSFVSLQLGATTRPQIEAIPAEIRPFDPMSDVTDFADTAAIIENLDLVIAVDTSTAHLAGALNKPVWMLSRFDQCWRWMTERDDTPWYPSMRLFRQTEPGEWESVIARAAHELRAFVESATKLDRATAARRPARKSRK
ncbi:tetratricopeptide repeat protein [Caballeronia glebae]|uniref:tetratricopeptide repeat protein n=1 Tax=Caballeronia glebae TaxID=1777143 RepID=UPI002E119319